MGASNASAQDQMVLRGLMNILRGQLFFLFSCPEANWAILKFEVVSLNLCALVGLLGQGSSRKLLIVTRQVHN